MVCGARAIPYTAWQRRCQRRRARLCACPDSWSPREGIAIDLKPPPLLAAAVLAVALGAITPSSALEQIVLDVGRIDGGTWSGEGVVVKLDIRDPERVSMVVAAAGLALPEPLHALSALSVDCARGVVKAAGIVCDDAGLTLGTSGGGERFRLAVEVQRDGHGWRLSADNGALAPGPVWDLAADLGLVPALAIGDGSLALSVALGEGAAGLRARVDAALTGITFSDEAGLNAGEGVGARLQGRLTAIPGGWRTQAQLSVDAGQMYLDPVFVDAGESPLAASASGTFDSTSGQLHLSRLRFDHRDVVAIEGALRVAADGELEDLDLRLARAPLGPVYSTYLQPFAIGTLFDTLAIDGDVQARIRWQPSPRERRVQVDLDGVGIDDTAGRFRLAGLRAHLDWSEADGREPSTLSWESGRFYRIDVGAGTLGGRLAARRFDLGAPVTVPMLDGALEVNDLRIDAIGTPDLEWKFRGSVQPMSLAALTRALDWPPFGGTLGSDIPLVSYARGVISVDGSLDVDVFGGRVRIGELGIFDPFGIIPVLRADVDIRDIDLSALTSTFSFGNIEGHLEGRVHGLILKDWKPTAFDARFATPGDDESRHRISQRAVENLASLGGTGAVLSSTFLRVFDEFSYRRLGISCRLQKGVCDMDGVAPAQRGYFIVEGGGIPRIDVLGFNRRVDWEVLLGRLRQIVTTDGPVIR